ncbi:MAG: hypothetical protein K1Y02_19745 [Candidatus Hydrogenedentes bacterium]|nr:hypothetical protein [Candidatus Hydrogenedentota bacterium]
MRRGLVVAAFAVASSIAVFGQEPVPEDFPAFIVPGHEQEMNTLRNFMWLHYPGSGPKATLWDEWLSTPSLWPAVDTKNAWRYMREQWARTLASRGMDEEGYVFTHQHASIAHQEGWPFPFWAQGQGGWGWHFRIPGMDRGWTGTDDKTQEGWVIEGATGQGIDDQVWNLDLTAPYASAMPPAMRIDPYNAPFLQLRWRAKGLGNAQPFVEWTTETCPEFAPERRMYFAPIEQDAVSFTMIPVYRHPEWKGVVTGLRIQFGNESPGAKVGIQSFFTNYDTRHNINNQNFIRGCANYFLWTRDLNFLRGQINRMRTAMRYILKEFHADETGIVVTDWVGHEGRSGLAFPNGQKQIRFGNGIGNNYWDLLPMGYKDCYATYQYYDALNSLAEIERAIATHPEWDIPRGVMAFTPDELLARAARAKRIGNQVFWHEKTGRFYCAVDIDGVGYDYGFTFLNLEAIYFGFATDEHAKSIMDWMCGDRIVEGDTSTGEDIYHWRFGPRSTTRRNEDYYFWAWTSPESIPWGGQVQDGGAVVGFSYYDLMARLQVRGADSVVGRLTEIAKWFDEVTAAGGYRKYYDGSREGTLQGGGTAGGLGADMEFFESALLPQIMVRGFLGMKPTATGLLLDPQLPSTWPELTVTRIRIRDAVVDVRATHDAIEVKTVSFSGAPGEHVEVSTPGSHWRVDSNAPAQASAFASANISETPGVTVRFAGK